MQEFFCNGMKMMEQAWDSWKKASDDSHFWPGDKMFRDGMRTWLSNMTRALDSTMDGWGSFTEKNREIFLKMYKESPFYNEAAEHRMRQAWSHIDEGRKDYQEAVKKNLARMEAILNETEQSEQA